jgi:hypothetical protein
MLILSVDVSRETLSEKPAKVGYIFLEGYL